MRLLERRLGEVSWSPTEQSAKADDFQKSLFEKEKVIKNLESEVENQVKFLQKLVFPLHWHCLEFLQT